MNSWLVSDVCYYSLIFKKTFFYIEFEFSRIFKILVETYKYSGEQVYSKMQDLFRETTDIFFHRSRLATFRVCDCGVTINECVRCCNGLESHCLRVVTEASFDVEAELFCLAEASALPSQNIIVPVSDIEQCVHEILSYGCRNCLSLLVRRCAGTCNLPLGGDFAEFVPQHLAPCGKHV